jgi:hypothetical protein
MNSWAAPFTGTVPGRRGHTVVVWRLTPDRVAWLPHRSLTALRDAKNAGRSSPPYDGIHRRTIKDLGPGRTDDLGRIRRFETKLMRGRL